MRRLQKLKECAEWLAFCLSIGWRRDQLDALEALWWQYHETDPAAEAKTSGGNAARERECYTP